MRKAAAASRYASYDSPSPSPSPSSSQRHVAPTAATAGDGSRTLVAVRSGRGDLRCLPPPQPQSHNHGNLGCVLRRLISMDKKPSANPKLPVPPAAIAPAKNSDGGAKLPGLSRKLLFQKGALDGKKKALAEVRNGGNGNTRTIAMVLRSERELLSQSKEHEDEIAALRLQLEQKDKEMALKYTRLVCFRAALVGTLCTYVVCVTLQEDQMNDLGSTNNHWIFARNESAANLEAPQSIQGGNSS